MYRTKITLTDNERVGVKYILRGATRRRSKALEAVRHINKTAGIQAVLYAVK